MKFGIAIDAFLVAGFADILAFLTVAIESIVADAFGKVNIFGDACSILVANFVVSCVDFTVAFFAVVVGPSTSVLLFLPFILLVYF